MKVSFDFDETLTRIDVQEYASELATKGIEVWITTSRLTEPFLPKASWNDDLYLLAYVLGIPKERIKFMNYTPKAEYILTQDFIFHLDDDDTELLNMKFMKCKTKPIQVNSPSWRQKCNRLIKETIYKSK